ncbi:mitochondrial import inner membrane translocase subunit TIM22 [Gymnopus androsaceus JB14]|uniref:Mitochondrial import inner membrane translocase subunit TIM22 n=1 Tax=Gymnopus androsaceus JB14 TaxID=1447944 RepID=A0A6A4IMG4_9AGAR|nr:mitochondrial import inner membrane translocase subunit TIM22 [Gymnopus androsaceus JB14]
MNGPNFPGLVPLHIPGKEPLPPGYTEEERDAYNQMKKTEKLMSMGSESCVFKSVLAGGGGLALGGFFSLMSSSFAYEDPLLRERTQAGMKTHQKASAMFKEMGRGMWSTGKSFGKVGMLIAGIECVIESYRGKNDIYNAVSAGFVTGGILARNSGPKGALTGALGFAAFSTAIDLWMRKETPDED